MGKILGKLSWERPFIPRWRVFCRVKESCDFSGSVWTVEARRAVESTDSFFILFAALWNFSFFFFFFLFFEHVDSISASYFFASFVIFPDIVTILGGWTMVQLKSRDILALRSIHFSFFLSSFLNRWNNILLLRFLNSSVDFENFTIILNNWKFE